MLLFKKKYKSIFLIIPITLFFRYDLVFFPNKSTDRIGEVFLSHMFGGSYNMEKASLTISVLGLIGIVYLSLVLADYVINEMQESAEYIFIRYSKRQKWYFKKIIGLFIYSNLGVWLYIIPYLTNALYESEQSIERKDFFIILCTYIMLVLFTYCLIISINVCGLFYDITIGFVLCYGILIISSELMILIQGLAGEKTAGILHRINPMSNLLVSWNFSDAHVLWGMMYYILLAISLTLYLWEKIKKYEIGIGYRKKYGRKWKKNE